MMEASSSCQVLTLKKSKNDGSFSFISSLSEVVSLYARVNEVCLSVPRTRSVEEIVMTALPDARLAVVTHGGATIDMDSQEFVQVGHAVPAGSRVVIRPCMETPATALIMDIVDTIKLDVSIVVVSQGEQQPPYAETAVPRRFCVAVNVNTICRVPSCMMPRGRVYLPTETVSAIKVASSCDDYCLEVSGPRCKCYPSESDWLDSIAVVATRDSTTLVQLMSSSAAAAPEEEDATTFFVELSSTAPPPKVSSYPSECT